MQRPNVVPTFSDEAVILDGHVPEDVQPLLDGEDEETAHRFGWWPQRSTEATVRAAFQRWADEWQSGGPTRAFAVRDAATRSLVGGCELRIQPDGTGHVSYWTSARHRQKGYAAHALGLLCRYTASLRIPHLEAHVATGNCASQRVAERAGFTAQDIFTDDGGQALVRYILTVPASRRPASPMPLPLTHEHTL
jgi:RimJ/RimL family protein N-acetyltransferase